MGRFTEGLIRSIYTWQIHIKASIQREIDLVLDGRFFLDGAVQ